MINLNVDTSIDFGWFWIDFHFSVFKAHCVSSSVGVQFVNTMDAFSFCLLKALEILCGILSQSRYKSNTANWQQIQVIRILEIPFEDVLRTQKTCLQSPACIILKSICVFFYHLLIEVDCRPQPRKCACCSSSSSLELSNKAIYSGVLRILTSSWDLEGLGSISALSWNLQGTCFNPWPSWNPVVSGWILVPFWNPEGPWFNP